MRICLVSREYPIENHRGGIATYTEKTARALAALGATVTVLTETEQTPRIVNVNNVEVRLLRPSAVRPRYLGRSLSVAVEVASLRPAPDIVQACEFEGECFGLALRKPTGIRLVTHLATPTAMTMDLNQVRATGLRTKTRFQIMDFMERVQTVRSDAIVSETDALADLVARRWSVPRQRIMTISQGVDFRARYFEHSGQPPTALQGRRYAIYFGRLEVRKGVHVLASALPAVLAKFPDFHFVFAGSDSGFEGKPMREYVMAQAGPFGNRLHFFPRLPQPELYPLLEHASFAVLPSLWENLANTGLEALDMGLPVIATLGCGFSEVIEDGVSGLLVPPGDADALAHAIERYLRDPEYLQSAAVAARHRAKAFGLLPKTAELLAFFERLSGAARGEDRPARVPAL